MILKGCFYSNVLEMETGISIVTPANLNYEQNADYKVVYLLHGLCGNHESWINMSMLSAHAYAGNTIYIMPEVGRSMYTNMVYGFDYFTYVAEELPQVCANLFNISAKREDTIVMGNSMGGYGALKIALSKPERFGKCAAFSSPCLFLKQEIEEYRMAGGLKPEFAERYGERIVKDFIAIFGNDVECDENSELLTLAQVACEKRVTPQIYMACGDEDYFQSGNQLFYQTLKNLKMDVTYEVEKGNHDFEFFDQALKKAIVFFAL